MEFLKSVGYACLPRNSSVLDLESRHRDVCVSSPISSARRNNRERLGTSTDHHEDVSNCARPPGALTSAPSVGPVFFILRTRLAALYPISYLGYTEGAENCRTGENESPPLQINPFTHCVADRRVTVVSKILLTRSSGTPRTTVVGSVSAWCTEGGVRIQRRPRQEIRP